MVAQTATDVTYVPILLIAVLQDAMTLNVHLVTTLAKDLHAMTAQEMAKLKS
jgi:hypothetical protein